MVIAALPPIQYPSSAELGCQCGSSTQPFLRRTRNADIAQSLSIGKLSALAIVSLPEALERRHQGQMYEVND
jgi:hypothetical protein